MANVDFQHLPSEKLEWVYQPKSVSVELKVHPMARRFDDFTPPSTKTIQAESFIALGMRDYMPLKILKRERFMVTARDVTVDDATADINSNLVTNPCPINRWNFFPDNFCLSKSVNNFKVSVSDLTLESTQNERNPWLIEAKSAQFDQTECERYGQNPLYTSNMGILNTFISPGALNQTALNAVQNPALVQPLKDANFVAFTESNKKVRATKKRWRIMGDRTGEEGLKPTFTDPTGATAGITASNEKPSYFGDWCPLVAGGAVYYGPIQGVYYIEVEEYFVDRYTTTPYQKSKEEKCIKIAPAQYATISFQYDTNYISNGMFNWVPQEDTPGTNNANTHSFTVQRLPDFSSITLESFDVITPPPGGFDFKILSWVPQRIDANPITLAYNATSATQYINDNNDDILAKYYFISYIPELWNGNQNATLIAGQKGPVNTSKYNPAEIIECEIQIGQDTITKNIPFKELIKMTEDTINNPEIADYIGLNKIYTWYMAAEFADRKSGCPFLLLDIEKLSLQNSKDCAQQMANVKYGALQNVKISLKIKDTAKMVSIGTSLVYTPHIYKFYPYLTSQREGGRADVDKQLSISFTDASRILSSPPPVNPYMNMNMMTGGGWFDDVKSYLKDNGQEILRMLMRGVRTGEELTRGKQGDLGHVNALLNIASDYAHKQGYGKRGGAIKNKW